MNKVKFKPPRPQGRLIGLRSTTPASYRSPSPAMLRSPSPAAIAESVKLARKGPAPCEQCGQTNFIEDGGQVICENCGAVSIDTGNFSNDVVFGETDSGRTQQVGTRVNEGQTHQRVFQPRTQGMSRVGQEAMQTSEKAKLEADSIFNKFCLLLGVRPREKNQASLIFNMAYANGFVRGRTIESVAIVCLYLATRRAKDANPPYALMLIDFAEPANINVFDLGRMMQDMVKKLYLGSDGRLSEHESLLLRAPGAEVLIEKFVKHLDFGNDEVKIRKDATKILQRMKKDWLHDGRRPSGVCGAAVILAARMNNYRRTLREVVLCAKVTEITVSKRLEEFKVTDSSKLSVNQFRDDETRDALKETDPPAYYHALNPRIKKKRGRPRKAKEFETAAEIEEGQSETESSIDGEQVNLGEPPQKRVRVDADGFAVPAVPFRTSQPPSSSTPVKRGPGKPKGSKNWKAPPPTAAEIAFENEMEHDIQAALDDNQDLDEVYRATSTNSRESTREPTLADVAVIQHDQHPRFDPPGPLVRSDEGNTGNVNMAEDIGDTEFDDDPEVSTCILSHAERALKEKIWVTENAEWLRQDHAKRIQKELKERHLIEQGIDPEELKRQKGKVIKRKDGARRSGRVGDVTYLRDEFHKRKKVIGMDENALDQTEGDVNEARDEDEEEVEEEDTETGPDAKQAHIAVRKMFNQRGTFSRRINYQNLLDAYQIPSDNSSLSPSRSPSRDREDSVASAATLNSEQGQRIDWFVRNGRGQRTRASLGQEKRQLREKAKREKADQLRSRSRSYSASPATTEADEADEEATNTPETAQHQLPTPNPTQKDQSGSRADKLPSEEPVSDTDSPLSSIHTPQGAHSGAPTPLHPASPLPLTSQNQIRAQSHEISEEDVESDEGDYVSEDNDDEDEDEDEDDGEEDVDAAFAGKYRSNDNYEWDDEVVEE